MIKWICYKKSPYETLLMEKVFLDLHIECYVEKTGLYTKEELLNKLEENNILSFDFMFKEI